MAEGAGPDELLCGGAEVERLADSNAAAGQHLEPEADAGGGTPIDHAAVLELRDIEVDGLLAGSILDGEPAASGRLDSGAAAIPPDMQAVTGGADGEIESVRVLAETSRNLRPDAESNLEAQDDAEQQEDKG